MTTFHVETAHFDRPADQVFWQLQESLGSQGFQIIDRDDTHWSVVATRTGSHGWFSAALDTYYAGGIGYPGSIKVHAHIEASGRDASTLFMETRQSYSWLSFFARRPRVTKRILDDLTKRLDGPGAGGG
jgi:hypothetical protein